MSRRNMSERAIGGLMLCEELGVIGGPSSVAPPSNTQTPERKALISFLAEILPLGKGTLNRHDPEGIQKVISSWEGSLKDLDSKLFAYKNGTGIEDGQSNNKALANLTKTLGDLLKQSGIDTRAGAVKVIDQIAEKYNLTTDQKTDIIEFLDAEKKQTTRDWFHPSEKPSPTSLSVNRAWTSTCSNCQAA
jgi:hypothetical protein